MASAGSKQRMPHGRWDPALEEPEGAVERARKELRNIEHTLDWLRVADVCPYELTGTVNTTDKKGNVRGCATPEQKTRRLAPNGGQGCTREMVRFATLSGDVLQVIFSGVKVAYGPAAKYTIGFDVTNGSSVAPPMTASGAPKWGRGGEGVR